MPIDPSIISPVFEPVNRRWLSFPKRIGQGFIMSTDTQTPCRFTTWAGWVHRKLGTLSLYITKMSNLIVDDLYTGRPEIGTK